mgnify:CR=1 FL=1|tara:strand:+ start:3575 stop:4795 length:1221 start_codon:yes stop_codon:yes gene_type:complete
MKKFLICLLIPFIVLIGNAENWPQFRGPTGQGHSNVIELPMTWSRTDGVAWQKSLGGEAWSSPICVKNQIFLTNALLEEELLRLKVVSIDFGSGEVLWSKTLFEYQNQPRIHKKNSYASPTPFYDDGHIFVHFGNLGTACLAAGGDLIWKKKLEYSPVHGSGASPVVFDDLLLISADGAIEPCLYALAKKTGEIKWKADRESIAKKKFSFCTPLVVEDGESVQIISPASDYVFAYDLKGNQIWKFNYPNGYSVVPRPVYYSGMIYVSSGYDSPTFYAIKTGGHGDITQSHLAWKTRKGAPRNSSVVITNGLVFMAADNGVVSCLDAKTGKTHWIERVASTCSPSMLHAVGKIFLSDETGKTFIFEAKEKYSLLATNDLQEKMLASPIAYQTSMIIRTEKNLWRIDP